MRDSGQDLSRQLYLDLMKKCLTRTLFPETCASLPMPGAIPALFRAADSIASLLGLKTRLNPALQMRVHGRDWPVDGETMIGLARLDNLQHCVTDVLQNQISGDLIETGVWRGGACIFMRAILKACGDTCRIVWAADSFRGLPPPDPRYPQDAGDQHWIHGESLGVSLDQVKANFARYGLLDDQVQFLSGWFKDTLPVAPIERIAVLRLDGDMYSSTMDALNTLYPKLSSGGYAIIDDYGAVPACKRAIEDYRSLHQIDEPLEEIDWSGVFWQKR